MHLVLIDLLYQSQESEQTMPKKPVKGLYAGLRTVLLEFVQDVQAAYGIGRNSVVDAKKMDWPDLLATYRHARQAMKVAYQPELYVLLVQGDIEPSLHGPYATQDEQQKVARTLKQQHGDQAGIYWLELDSGVPKVGAYSRAFFEKGQ